MDEFDLTLKNIKSKNSVLADCFLQLPIIRSVTGEKGNLKITVKQEQSGNFVNF